MLGDGASHQLGCGNKAGRAGYEGTGEMMGVGWVDRETEEKGCVSWGAE